MENTNSRRYQAIGMAILAASLYGISAPIAKLLLEELSPTIMAAALYLGAGIGMLFVNIIKKLTHSKQKEARMTKKELPFIIGMILLDIAAPVLLMIGLTKTTSANVSLLNNFEIVATSLIALFIFKETIGKRMWIAIGLITMSSMLLSIQDAGSFSFSIGSIFVILACLAWGLENNCTRMLSIKDPLQIVVVKGFGSGIGALLIAILLGETSHNVLYITLALILGFFAFGLSIYFYIRAQRELGAARTSAYYAAAPFIGVLISWIFLKEGMTGMFIFALIVMIIGTYFAMTEKHKHKHTHINEKHEHSHHHLDGHHTHTHDYKVSGEHSHVHMHEEVQHKHEHTPDLHHRHIH